MAELTSSSEKPRKSSKKSPEGYELIENSVAPAEITSALLQESTDTIVKVRSKQTGEIHAMRIVLKKAVRDSQGKEEFKGQVKMQRTIRHPHITRLVNYFEDKRAVYFLLEYVENGSLFDYLKKKKHLEEREAFVFFFQTYLALDYLHKRRLIHGSVKSRNLLLDKGMNLKLGDFGLKAGRKSIRESEYAAPELAEFQFSGRQLDIWHMGILLYEMLHGFAPFKGKSTKEKLEDMTAKKSLYFSPNLSEDAVNLVKSIIQTSSIEFPSMKEILNHSWMKKYESEYKIDFEKILKQQDDIIRAIDRDFRLSTAAQSELVSPDLTEEKLDNFAGQSQSPPEEALELKATKSNSEKSEGARQLEMIDFKIEEEKEEERPKEEEVEVSWWVKILGHFGCCAGRY